MNIAFTRGNQRFEIRHEPSRRQFPYVGYVDDELSTMATRADIVARILIRDYSKRTQNQEIGNPTIGPGEGA